MDFTKTITHLGLCAGYGGIELGLKRVIPTLRSVALCEIESFAIANLVSKMEAGLMDAAPIWTGLKTFPWAEFRDRVDILTGGYPCQPFSAAGKRLGTEDPRHLWPYIADGIRLLRPRICFFENVEGHISLGLREVIGELESMGYKVSWGIFSAREVGAPHQRKRVFILAYRHGERGQLPDWWREPAKQVPVGYGEAWRDGQWPSRPGEQQYGWEPPRTVANAGSVTRWLQAIGWEYDGETGSAGESVGNADSIRPAALRAEHEGQCGELCSTSAGGEGIMGNTEGGMPWQSSAGNWREGAGGASEELADNLRGRLPHTTNEQWNSGTDDHAVIRTRTSESGGRQTQPSLGGDSDGTSGGLDYAELFTSCDNRTDELRLLGNGVVPATAALAFRTLMNKRIYE